MRGPNKPIQFKKNLVTGRLPNTSPASVPAVLTIKSIYFLTPFSNT